MTKGRERIMTFVAQERLAFSITGSTCKTYSIPGRDPSKILQ